MHKHLLRWSWVLLGVLIAGFAHAVTPTVHVSAKPVWISACKPYNVRPSARNIEDGAYNELLEEQINVETHSSYNHIITQIVSETGVQNNSEISVSFNPAYERLDFHDITLWRNGKPQNRLNVNAFKVLADESEFDRFIYNGTYAAKYILADVRKGDRIEYSYTISGANPIFNGKFARSIYFQGYSIIAHQYTTLLVSAGRKLNMRPINKNPKMIATDLPSGMKRYEWEGFQVKPVNSVSHVPSWYNEFNRVQISDYTDWAEVINWAMKVNPLTTTFKGELASAIAKLKKDADGDKQKYFRDAVKLVQDEVRYMGIETGEYSHRANDPDKVFKQRYGDCKDKSLLLASILQAGGIEAHIALISTSLRDKLDDFLPSAMLFNHCVAVANLNGKNVWVDATIANQRGTGTNIYFPAYKRGLVIKPDNNALTHIPLSPAGKIMCTETYTMLNEKDSVNLDIRTVYTLNEADETRDRLASSSMSETEKSYLEYYSKIYSGVEARDSLEVKDDEILNQLTTIEHYKIGKYLKPDSTDGKYHGEFYANMINERLPKINGQTKTPVALSFPTDVDHTVKLVLPGAWNIDDRQDSIIRPEYQYRFDLLADGKTLSLHYRLTYLNDFIPANHVSDYRQDVKELSDQKLSFNFSYTPQGGIKQTGKSDGNILMMVFTVLLFFGCLYLGIYLYHKHTRSLRFHGYVYGRALGGWLILPMIGLFATILSLLNYILTANYFKLATWNVFTQGIKAILFKGFLVFELGCFVVMICLCVFCLVLMFKKRDIAPKYMIGLYVGYLIFAVAEYFMGIYFNTELSTGAIVRGVVAVAIWVPYFKRSVRVKETFIVPYPEK